MIALAGLAILSLGLAARGVEANRRSFKPVSYDASQFSMATYDHCVYDPESSATFQLLDSKTYRPVYKDGDKVLLGGDDDASLANLAFRAINRGPNGQYDIVLDDEDGSTYFLAVLGSGDLGWTTVSSQDTSASTSDNDDKTHIFSILCTGRVIAGVEGEAEIGFTDDQGQVVAVPANRTANSPFGLPSTTRGFVVLPHTSDTSDTRISSRNDLVDPQRCPPGLTARTKSPNPPVYPNGCGVQGGINPPDFNFGDCCNAHDACYSTCGRSFDSCNDAFEQCMYKRCDVDYDGVWEVVPLGFCKAGAFVYASAVKVGGEDAFRRSTTDHCDCVY